MKEKKADRRRGGKTISKSGQEWTFPAQLGQLKTGQDGKGLLQIHLGCPDDLPRLWDRIDRFYEDVHSDKVSLRLDQNCALMVLLRSDLVT